MATPSTAATWTPAAINDLERVAAEFSVTARRQEPLRRYTSFGVGGPTPLMAFPEHPGHVSELARWAGRRGLRWRILGGGTNLLVGDTGVDEPVLNLARLCVGTEVQPNRAHFAAGLPTARALNVTIEAGLEGLEWAAGLPGTIGGAAAGNAGCWGGDMAACTAYLDVVDGEGETHRVDAEALTWEYRRLSLPASLAAPWSLIAVGIQVEPEAIETLRDRYDQLQRRKRERQPIGARNSGCIFRNPEGAAAGAVLDAAGCKGMRVGGAVVSDRHANFIVNDRGATAADIAELIERLIAAGRRHAGLDLRPEVRRW